MLYFKFPILQFVIGGLNFSWQLIVAFVQPDQNAGSRSFLVTANCQLFKKGQSAKVKEKR
jgi:hypothetical protein